MGLKDKDGTYRRMIFHAFEFLSAISMEFGFPKGPHPLSEGNTKRRSG
jgi:hypothetical protein